MNFGEALEAMKAGKKISRAGWNGKGMYLFMNKGQYDLKSLGFEFPFTPVLDHPSTIDGVGLGLFAWGTPGHPSVMPSVVMKTASGSLVFGWLASQTDMFASDWVATDG